jgi:hypothetical protein
MKYEVISSQVLSEVAIDENLYSVEIGLYIHPIDGIAPDFNKNITVVSNNKQTGYEVDAQRKQEISIFMETLNK